MPQMLSGPTIRFYEERNIALVPVTLLLLTQREPTLEVDSDESALALYVLPLVQLSVFPEVLHSRR